MHRWPLDPRRSLSPPFVDMNARSLYPMARGFSRSATRPSHSARLANPMPEDLLCVKGEDVLHTGRASDHVASPPHKRTPDLIPIRPNRVAIGHLHRHRRRPHSFCHLVLCRSISSIDEIFPLRRETRDEEKRKPRGRYKDTGWLSSSRVHIRFVPYVRCPRREPFIARSTSRPASRCLIDSRRSYCFLPRASAISTLAWPRGLK